VCPYQFVVSLHDSAVQFNDRGWDHEDNLGKGKHIEFGDVGQNTVELWTLESGGGWVHPVHVHLVVSCGSWLTSSRCARSHLAAWCSLQLAAAPAPTGCHVLRKPSQHHLFAVLNI
jgi:hypothetical protein